MRKDKAYLFLGSNSQFGWIFTPRVFLVLWEDDGWQCYMYQDINLFNKNSAFPCFMWFDKPQTAKQVLKKIKILKKYYAYRKFRFLGYL